MRVDLNVVPPSIEFQDALDLKDPNSNNSKHVDIIRVIHSDGLLLCITNWNIPVVWNPLTGETRWIHHENGFGRCNFALGYENKRSCRSYKILMFYGEVGGLLDYYEIYEFNSNSWSDFDDLDDVFMTPSDGLTLKGNIYWRSFDYEDNYYLLSFDFTRERFRSLCLPLTFQNCKYMALSVVREEELSVLTYTTGSSKMEMWVTNKIDTCEADLSWSKFFVVDHVDFVVGSSILIDEEKKVALFFCCEDLINDKVTRKVCTIGEEDDYYTEIPLSPWSELIFNYVPSLVQIKQHIESDEVIMPNTDFLEKIMHILQPCISSLD